MARIIKAYRRNEKVHDEGAVLFAEEEFNNEMMRPTTGRDLLGSDEEEVRPDPVKLDEPSSARL